MGECEFSIIRENNFIRKGDVASFKVEPEIRYPCSAKFLFNKRLLNQYIGNDIDDIHVAGLSAGHVSVRALTDNPSGQLTVEVTCQGEDPCGPTTKSIDFAGLASNSHISTVANIDIEDVLRFIELIRRLLLLPFWMPTWLIVRIILGKDAAKWIRECAACVWHLADCQGVAAPPAESLWRCL